MQPKPSASSTLHLAEVMAALSLATDLGMGQPLEFALASCVLATRLGESLGLPENELRDVYYFGLLRFIGCNSDTHAIAALLGDELSLRSAFAAVDPGNTPQVLNLTIRFLRQAHAGAPPLDMARTLIRGVLSMPQFMQEQFSGHCEVAQRLAERLGFGRSLIQALGQLYERWDGAGLPHGLKGEAVSPAVLLVTLAQDVVTYQRLGDLDAAVQMVRTRSGGAYDPHHAEHFCAHATTLMQGLEDEPSWELVLACEPGKRHALSEAQLDTACQALADFADIKSPYTLGHSSHVADLAAAAAGVASLGETEALMLRRAGMLHDLGRVGISAGIWTRPGPLTEREWEQVRLHPYYTERILARPAAFAAIGEIAALHQERLDGSGYHRRLPASLLSPAARLLAAADVFQALLEPRPHRPARTPDAAATELARAAQAGRLDPDAVRYVLAAAGQSVQSVKQVRPTRPAQLTERELEVLRLIARGHSIKQMAQQLTISPKTVDSHIQHIYEKLGVSTRAGATLFAVEHNLLMPTAATNV
jgi:HD-GYP domain-containing protein (c-di-GMP phosphodiesterase class II)